MCHASLIFWGMSIEAIRRQTILGSGGTLVYSLEIGRNDNGWGDALPCFQVMVNWQKRGWRENEESDDVYTDRFQVCSMSHEWTISGKVPHLWRTRNWLRVWTRSASMLCIFGDWFTLMSRGRFFWASEVSTFVLWVWGWLWSRP